MYEFAKNHFRTIFDFIIAGQSSFAPEFIFSVSQSYLLHFLSWESIVIWHSLSKLDWAYLFLSSNSMQLFCWIIAHISQITSHFTNDTFLGILLSLACNFCQLFAVSMKVIQLTPVNYYSISILLYTLFQPHLLSSPFL